LLGSIVSAACTSPTVFISGPSKVYGSCKTTNGGLEIDGSRSKDPSGLPVSDRDQSISPLFSTLTL
jgi:hypothetical protein